MKHIAIGLLVGLLVGTPCAHGAGSAQDDPRLGCWLEQGGSTALLLEAARAGWLVNGAPRFYRARLAPGGATLEAWGRETEYELVLEGERLHVTGEGKDLWMRRQEVVPELLLVAPYALPALAELDPELVADLRADLLARRAEDQRVRSDDFDVPPAEMQRVDDENTEFMRSIIGELGWIDATRFGAPASDAAFLIVQHTSDLRLMRTALPLIERDVRAGLLNGQNYALLYDRLQLNLGFLQRYGSQLGIVGAEHLLMPCEDIEHIDELRAELGMGPLSEYLGYFEDAGTPPIRHLGQGQYGERREGRDED